MAITAQDFLEMPLETMVMWLQRVAEARQGADETPQQENRVEGDGSLTMIARFADGREVTMNVPAGQWAGA